MKGRLWNAFALTAALVWLLTRGVAAGDLRRTGAVRLHPPVLGTAGTEARSSRAGAWSSGRAVASAVAVYLPSVWQAYSGCSAVPTLIQPANGSNLSTLCPLFGWNDGNDPWAMWLRMELARDAEFTDSAGHMATGIHGEYQFRFTGNLQPSTTYYWRAYLVCGNMQGPYSEVWSFCTGSGGTILPAPTLLAPANGSTTPSSTVTLQWSPLAGAIEYAVYYRRPGLWFHTLEWRTDTQKTTYLDAHTTYEWWVAARNDYAVGTESPKWRFTTGVESSP
jgi:hypothetical protein